MVIKPIASGSSGNCYLVSDGQTDILLDCGINEDRIRTSLWQMCRSLPNVEACLVTHSHGDHSKCAQRLADIGTDVYASPGTIRACNLSGHRIKPVKSYDKSGDLFCIGSFVMCALEVEHDAPETLAFVLSSGKEKLLYVTDTEFFKYKIDGLTHIMIEANYDADVLAENTARGIVNDARAKRTVANHMSIETALLTLSRLDRSQLKEVWLLHLSGDNAGSDFVRRAQELTGVEVYLA